nr:hypothetical protein [Tanacetum cinerariifolium]
MSPNTRKLKRKIKPPWRYEGYVSAISKRNDSDHETSNDESSMKDKVSKGIKEVEVYLDHNGIENKEINEVLEGMNTVNVKMQNKSMEGISALASSLGKPKIMDAKIAHVCQFHVEMSNHARVLMEIKVNKELKDVIKIEYIRENEAVKGIKDEDNMEDFYENEEGVAQTMTADNVRDTMRAKRIVLGWPWIMIEDFNVTLKIEEHSDGGSRISNDIQEFIDYVNDAKIEDLCSNEVFYTWIKSPLTLKIVSLKSWIELCVEKEEFIPIVKSGWTSAVHGCKMFKLMKKMKGLKSKLKAFSWKNRNLYEIVENYKKNIKEAQYKLNNNPHDQSIKKKEVMALVEYNGAIRDEENLLFYKAKVDWIIKCNKKNLY